MLFSDDPSLNLMHKFLQSMRQQICEQGLIYGHTKAGLRNLRKLFT